MDKDAFMQACRDGGARIEAALRELDAAYAQRLHRECRSVVRDRGRADDLVQDTMIKVWQRCATFRGDAELLGWIRTILRHAIVDHFRAAKPEESWSDGDADLSPQVEARVAELSMAERSGPEDRVARDQAEAVYRAAFARFEADFPLHAAVMRWVAEDGLSNGEIEALLQRSPGATREFVSQCRKKARLYLADWYVLMGTNGDA